MAFVAADLIHGEAQLGNRLFDGDAAFGVLAEVLARSGYCLAVLSGEFVFFVMHHGFQKPDHGGKLTGA
jgi:hypothetical protein